MSLPWFAFHIDKFLSDTLALDGEAIGAYVLLMLHYYATETPPRDNDRALATIARLPMDRWLDRRPEIAACFQIRDGAWHHPTIEAEIAEAKEKHAAGIARATAGAAARWGKTPAKPAASNHVAVPQASSELKNSIKHPSGKAIALLQAKHEQSLLNAHLQEQNLSLSVLDVDVEKDNSGDNSGAGAEETLGTPIDPKFWPCENHITICNIDGASTEMIEREVGAFVARHRAAGTFSNDWDASWSMWWKRWRDWRDSEAAKEAKKAKPRVEVSSRFQPTDEQWQRACEKFAKDGSGWSRQYGPEPGMGGCRCPKRIVILAGINPTTGLKMTPREMALAMASEPEKV